MVLQALRVDSGSEGGGGGGGGGNWLAGVGVLFFCSFMKEASL